MIHPNATDVWAALSSSAVRTCYDFRTGDSQEEEHPQEPQHAALGAQRSSGAERRQLRGAHPQGTWHRLTPTPRDQTPSLPLASLVFRQRGRPAQANADCTALAPEGPRTHHVLATTRV